MPCISLEIGRMSVALQVFNQICVVVTGKGKSHVQSVCSEVHVKKDT